MARLGREGEAEITKLPTERALDQPSALFPYFAEDSWRLTFAQPCRLPDSNDWSYEPKLDGYRCLAAKSTGRVMLWSRRGNLFTARFPEITHACENLASNTLIDGEVIAIDEDGRVSFNALQHGRSNAHIQFYAFDVLIHRGRNVLRLRLEERRELLAHSLRKVAYPVLRSGPFDAKPSELIRAAKTLEIEGIIAKRKGSIYESGRRSGAWLKYKINRSQEFVIGGYTPGNPFDALIVGFYDAAELKFVTKVRNGFVPRVRREVYQQLTGLRTTKCPFSNLPEKKRTVWALTADEMKECRWVKPQLVVQIAFSSPPLQTGRDPTSKCRIFSAARCNVSFDWIVSTPLLTNSLTCIEDLLNKPNIWQSTID